MTKEIKIRYFALLREESGLSGETRRTSAVTLAALYDELKKEHSFSLPLTSLRVAVNDEFVAWDSPVQESTEIVFIPPVAGG
ncbi:MAG: MoaD/ThiS family protein [Candidatus Obscuribacterales bacterium]|nr:MoaD/ThiS family protein [Candidatus Obscuribacterales bacterium]